jgi:hypothetical protein
MVQILGRTLPTFNRLHKFRSRLYPSSDCKLCGQETNETIEHLFFRCAETASRRSLLIDQCVLLISERQKTLHSQETVQVLKNLLFDILDKLMKFRSAGQLSKTLKTWLSNKGIQGSRATRIGKKLHMKIL